MRLGCSNWLWGKALVGALSVSWLLSACLGQYPTTNEHDASLVASSSGCVTIDDENAFHLVKACETARNYVVQVRENQIQFDKRLFQFQLANQLGRLLHGSDSLSASILHEASVDIWLAAPVLQPESVYLVAVLHTDPGTITVDLPFTTNATVTDGIRGEQIAWLGRGHYPTAAAWHIDRLILLPQPTVTPERLKRFLNQSGVLGLSDKDGHQLVQKIHGDGTVLRLETLPFAAAKIQTALKNAPLSAEILARVDYEPAVATDAYAKPVFHFNLH